MVQQPLPTTTVTGTAVPADIPGGDDVWNIIPKSPTLNDQYRNDLIKDGWRIRYDGAPGKGTYTESWTKTIVVDSNYKGNPALEANSLAHEFGHATHTLGGGPSTQDLLNNEGIATMNNIMVQREILAGGGPDIGIAGNDPTKFDFNTVYDQ